MRDPGKCLRTISRLQGERAAAEINVKVQNEKVPGRPEHVPRRVTAINDWGNAVTSEAGVLLSYGVAFATLEAQTRTSSKRAAWLFNGGAFPRRPSLLLHRSYPSANIPSNPAQLYPRAELNHEPRILRPARYPAPRNTKSGPASLPAVELTLNLL